MCYSREYIGSEAVTCEPASFARRREEWGEENSTPRRQGTRANNTLSKPTHRLGITTNTYCDHRR